MARISVLNVYEKAERLESQNKRLRKENLQLKKSLRELELDRDGIAKVKFRIEQKLGKDGGKCVVAIFQSAVVQERIGNLDLRRGSRSVISAVRNATL